jgi:MFS family permease
MVACTSFFSPLSANIYFPSLPSLAKDLKVSNSLINLSLTSYMIFQGLPPTVFGDLADMTGRRPTLIIGFIIYIGANIGLALQDNYAALLVLRCLQSTGSSGTVALGNGIVADIASSGERGKFYG